MNISCTRSIRVAPLLIVMTVLSICSIFGCGRSDAGSAIRSVDIPQTPVKSQNKVGFCWAYATMGFLESLMLKRTGQSLDLSEEALGFYRMAEELRALTTKYKPEDLADVAAFKSKVFEDLEGWDLIFYPEYNPGLPVRGSLQLVREYGAVPEYAWSYKFLSSQQVNDLLQFVAEAFVALYKEQGSAITREMIFDLLARPEAYGSRPPQQFDYVLPSGVKRTMTPAEFVEYMIGFSPDAYTYLIPDAQIDYGKIVTAIKWTLSRGIDVPLSYSIYADSENDWDASYSTAGMDLEHLENEGGHVVLLTDFVNKGGRPGALPDSLLGAELAKSPDELDFLVLKNSWNTKLQSPLLPLPGYFTMKQDYVRLLARTPVDIMVVVPRDIAMKVRYGDL